MPLFPATLIPWVALQFSDSQGHPLVGGKLYCYVAGTSTPQPVYTHVDCAPGTEHTNPVVLDASGRPTMGPIYVLPTGYKYVLHTVDDTFVWSIDNVEDVGAAFAARLGLVLSTGGKNVTSGYQVLTTDRLVTVASTGAADPCVINLPRAADATQPLTIKNMGTVALAIRPNGVDTIEGRTVEFPYEVPEAVAPLYPAVTLVSDGTSAWWVTSSHF